MLVLCLCFVLCDWYRPLLRAHHLFREIYQCVCLCVCACRHARVGVLVRAHVCVYMHVWRAYVSVCVRACICECMCVRTCGCACTLECAHACTCTTRACVCARVHACVRECACLLRVCVQVRSAESLFWHEKHTIQL